MACVAGINQIGPWGALALATLLVAALALLVVRVILRNTDLGTPADRATFATLHTATQAAPHLREGLTPTGATRAARHLRTLLGTAAVAITDSTSTLAWDGAGAHHSPAAIAHAGEVLRTGSPMVLAAAVVACDDAECPIRSAVVAPVTADDRVVGAADRLRPVGLQPGLVRATDEVARGCRPRSSSPTSTAQRTRAHGGRAAGPAGPDQPALHLQLPRRHRLLRAHRPRAGTRAAAGVRRLHPLRLPPRR